MRMRIIPIFSGPKVLEVNAKHPLVKALNSRIEAGEAGERCFAASGPTAFAAKPL